MGITITNDGPQTIGAIKEHFEYGNIFLSPDEYQRENAWNIPQKKLLIDTIFRGMDVPKFYLWKVNHQTLKDGGYPDGDLKDEYKRILDDRLVNQSEVDPHIYEVVDGQQRIRTILEYMGVEPPNDFVYRGEWLTPFHSEDDTPNASGKLFKELNPNQRMVFTQKNLSVVILENSHIDDIRDMFLRLQNGTPLNAQQKRDAMGSNSGRAARELAELPFFTKSVSFGNTKSEHRWVASQMLNLEVKRDFTSCTSPMLNKFYEDYKSNEIEPAVSDKAKRILKMLGKIFPDRSPYLKNRGYALSLYWILSKILKDYKIAPSQYPKIRENFERFEVRRLEAMKRDYKRKGDDIYQNLSYYFSRSTDAKDAITERHTIITQPLFENIALEELPNLDPNRNFSDEEKMILYYRCSGRCQMEHNGKVCNRKIDYEDAAVDHITPHSKGGKTELNNGRIAHKLCNIARGNKDSFDPETQCHFKETE